MKKLLVLLISILLLLLPVETYAKDYFVHSDESADTIQTDYSIPQKKLTVHEEKIYSPAFGKAIGRVIVPDGWNVKVVDLGLGTESITCPNVVYVTVTSQDGDCELSYISRREFIQEYSQFMGFEFRTVDDEYVFDSLVHTLNYRLADACCDFMVLKLYGDIVTKVIDDFDFTEEEKASMQKAMDEYEQSVIDAFRVAGEIGIDLGQLMGCESSVAKRQYHNYHGDMIVCSASCGFAMEREYMGAVTDTMVWDIPFVYGIRAESVEEYQELFDLFCAVTSVSKEYNEMCAKNAERLTAEYARIRNYGGSYTCNDNSSYQDIEEETIDTGDTYSAVDAWDDYIRDETDYTTGTGEHVKISSQYDHVFEVDDDLLYVTNSSDGPYGGMELDPTSIG